MKILFATANKNKANEISRLLPSNIELLTLNDIELNEEIPETSDTIEGNALQKTRYIANRFAINCFADDTGLEVFSLGGEPGVHSARYAGEHRSDADNISLLLENLSSKTDRNARFKTVISLYLNNQFYEFTGIAEGEIIDQQRGESGFGYDPIFVPKGSNKTFAEMSMDEKNAISHRAKAFEKLIEFLNG